MGTEQWAWRLQGLRMDWRLGAALFQVRSTQWLRQTLGLPCCIDSAHCTILRPRSKSAQGNCPPLGLLLERKATACCEGAEF